MKDRKEIAKLFKEGDTFDTQLPVTIHIEEVVDDGGKDVYFYIDVMLQESLHKTIEELDEPFIRDFHINAGTGAYPEALLELLPKEKAKLRTRCKKQIEAKIKELQKELDSL